MTDLDLAYSTTASQILECAAIINGDRTTDEAGKFLLKAPANLLDGIKSLAHYYSNPPPNDLIKVGGRPDKTIPRTKEQLQEGLKRNQYIGRLIIALEDAGDTLDTGNPYMIARALARESMTYAQDPDYFERQAGHYGYPSQVEASSPSPFAKAARPS